MIIYVVSLPLDTVAKKMCHDAIDAALETVDRFGGHKALERQIYSDMKGMHFTKVNQFNRAELCRFLEYMDVGKELLLYVTKKATDEICTIQIKKLELE